MSMPDGFCTFKHGSDDLQFRQEMWNRSCWSDIEKETDYTLLDLRFLPCLLTPPQARKINFGNFNFEDAVKVVYFFATLKKSKMEWGPWPIGGRKPTTSSAHRRVYFPTSDLFKNYIRTFCPDQTSKVQLEPRLNRRQPHAPHIRFDLARVDPRYAYENWWVDKLGDTHDTEESVYKNKILKILSAEGLLDKELERLDLLWTHFYDGYRYEEPRDPSGLSLYDLLEIKEIEALGHLEGTYNGVRKRASGLRQHVLQHLRLNKKPFECEICKIVAQDDETALSGFEVAHKTMLASLATLQETNIPDDIMFLCRTCHGIYTHFERIYYYDGSLATNNQIKNDRKHTWHDIVEECELVRKHYYKG